jgi:predicted ATPase/class 3 adenylate cyclase
MRCAHCEGDNPPPAKFCSHCGSGLSARCTACGHSNAPGTRFCNECGRLLDSATAPAPVSGFGSPRSYTPKHLAERILTSKSALEGERKQVTVLFCDIVESMVLAEQLGPEGTHEVLDRVLRLMAEIVHRYEGTVNQFLGDGLMALFGAPLALEDHAVRAVEAALSIQETINGYSEQLKRERGLDLKLRLGLNSGLVVVGRIGDDLRMDYTAVGDTTNVAARIQALAEPGTILMTDATHRLVEGYIRTEQLGPMSVKGKSGPVVVFRVTGHRRHRSRLDVNADRGLTALIGRERELAVLQDCLVRAKSARGQAVGLVGEPGVGKSRLLYEFRRTLEGQAVTWLEGRCVASGQSTPYLPILEVLRANFQIEEGDNPLQTDEKLRHGTRQIDARLESILPFLRELFGLLAEDETLKHLGAKDKRRKIFEAVRALTVAGAHWRPLVLVLEDLHWIDETSEEFLAFFVESLAGIPALLLTTHRPGYMVKWADKRYYTQISLDLLGEAEVATMVARLLGTEQVPPDFVRVVWEKAEGNPLFVEEITTALREGGLLRPGAGSFAGARNAVGEFPDTMQDIISARLDRLDEAVKWTAQTAAVIGREFSLNLLASVSEIAPEVQQYLDTLRRQEFVHEKRFFPELEYTFKHAVIQEVAYRSLLTHRSRERHGAIGRAIEEIYGGRLEEQTTILAYHYAHSENQDKAIAYALLAGDRAARLYANAEATAYYERALNTARTLDASPDVRRAVIDATIKLAAVGATRQDVTERDRGNLEEARAIAEALPDESRLAQVLYWLGRIAYLRWQPSSAIAYVKQSLDIAERLGDESLAAAPTNLIGRIYWQQSDYKKASELLERSAEQMRRLGNKTEEATAAGFAGFALGLMGEFDRALAYTEHGLQLAQEIKNPFAEASLYLERAIVRGERGQWALAFADFDQARRGAEQVGDVFRVYIVNFFEGRVHTIAGDPRRGRALIEESLAQSEQIGTRFARAWQKSLLAQALHALGELAAVPALCEEAIRLADETEDRFPKALGHRTLAHVFMSAHPPEHEKAEAHVREAIRIYREIGTRPELARSYVSYARLLQVGAQHERAEELLTNAITLFQEMGMIREVEEATEMFRRS